MPLLATLLALMTTFDVHTMGNPERVRPVHMALELTLDFERKVIDGQVELTLAYADQARAHTLMLDTKDLTIREVVDVGSGRPLTFDLQDAVPHLGRPLAITLPDPRPDKVRIGYATAPGASALQWLEPRQTTSGKLPFLFTQSQAIHARSWIPCVDSPGARVTFDATIRVPPGVTVVMGAEHGEHQPARGVFRFRMQQSIPPYLLALAAGEIAFKALSERTGVYAEPAVLERAAHEFADMEKMVQVAESLYGPYAWGRWDTIVLPPSFPFGGMENPRLTFATPTLIAGDRSLVSVMAHELAHSWSGNLVTNATWADFWLNEGLTTYIENRIVESLYGREVAEMQQLLGQRDLHQSLERIGRERPHDTRLYCELAGRDPDDGFSLVPYEKGANLLRILEQRFGRARFDAFVRQYFADNAFQSVTTAGFLQRLKKRLFKDKDDEATWNRLRVEEWVYGRGLPDNLIVPVSTRFETTHAAAETFGRSGSLEEVETGQWVTAEWQDFLQNLPPGLTHAQLEKLDSRFELSSVGNSEILFDWLMVAVANTYEPAFASLEDFLTRQGRRKFLAPLYRALMARPATRERGQAIYAKGRPRYHPIAVATIDSIMAQAAQAAGGE